MLASVFYAWLALPFLIFLARVVDVTMGTVRVIFVSRGMKYLAPVKSGDTLPISSRFL